MSKYKVVINGEQETEKDFVHLYNAKNYAYKNKNKNNIVDVIRISDQSIWLSL